MSRPPRDPDPLEPLAVLGEPVRRRLYEFVVAAGAPVDRDAAAAGVGIGRPLAAFHLDRLVEARLLEVEFRRRSERRGPGAGRPAKFYFRPAGREISVSLPPRHYDLAAEILAEGVEARPEATALVLDAAARHGAELAAATSPGLADGEAEAAASADPLVAFLVARGYEPFADDEGTIRLRNCPFHALVGEHRELVCGMNLALLRAAVGTLEGTDRDPIAQPRAGLCCVAFPEA